MALKTALITFEFESFGGLQYDPACDFRKFATEDPRPGEYVQPVIDEAFSKIIVCLEETVNKLFHNFGKRNNILNIDNSLHIGTEVAGAGLEVQHNDGTFGKVYTVLHVKFYRLEPSITYKVSIDIENLPSSSMNSDNPIAFNFGIKNENIVNLVKLLDKEFKLNGKIEYLPLIKRGRTTKPHYLVSSDERLMEYDFGDILFDQQSEYQNVKIVSSPSLGNTLLLDNLQNLAEVDTPYTYALMDRGNVSYKDKEILILGGGDGGLLWELLKESPKFVTMAEIDPVVIEACRRHLKPCGKVLEKLEGENYKIIVDDCIKILRKSFQDGKRYDVIFNDLTDIPVAGREESLTAFDPSCSQADNPWHFIEAIFNLSLDCLTRDGLYMSHTTGKGNVKSLEEWENFLDDSKIKVEYEKRSSYVPSFMEIWVFYTIKKKKGDTRQVPGDKLPNKI